MIVSPHYPFSLFLIYKSSHLREINDLLLLLLYYNDFKVSKNERICKMCFVNRAPNLRTYLIDPKSPK